MDCLRLQSQTLAWMRTRRPTPAAIACEGAIQARSSLEIAEKSTRNFADNYGPRAHTEFSRQNKAAQRSPACPTRVKTIPESSPKNSQRPALQTQRKPRKMGRRSTA